MHLIIDSNRFIDFCAGEESVIATLESAATIYIPFIVLGEIRAGGLVTRRGQNQVRTLQELLNQPGIQSLNSTDTTSHHYATLYAQLRKNGTPIPTNDLWIAALAVEHDLILYSRDSHFNLIPSLARRQ
ncbi:MAG: type II toxin-antitoxin system VapC family toxin [Methylacidiphilales bacterium]|nr:type II toxin-antitoxin system VapC family toxin [Candidatus Methylacidiphilales bacterium]